MSAEPSISAAAFTPFICRLLVLAMPLAILASPRMKSKAKPWLNTSRKVEREPARQRLQAQHAQQLGQAGVGLQELALLHVDLQLPAQAGVVERERRAAPVDVALEPALAAPQHARHAEAREQLAGVGDVEPEGHGRCGAGRPCRRARRPRCPWPAKLASGMVKLSLLSAIRGPRRRG
jgi:hypothetical protein